MHVARSDKVCLFGLCDRMELERYVVRTRLVSRPYFKPKDELGSKDTYCERRIQSDNHWTESKNVCTHTLVEITLLTHVISSKQSAVCFVAVR